MIRRARLTAAAAFVLPLLALLAIWEAVVRAFDVSPASFRRSNRSPKPASPRSPTAR